MKKDLFLLLAALFVFSLFKSGLAVFLHFLIVVCAAVTTDIILTKLQKSPFFIPLAALDSGFIISFVLDPASSVLFKLLAPVLAIFSKHFIKRKEEHIFNPAAFGLFLASILGAPVSWWVGTMGIVFDLVLIGGMIYVLRKARRLRIVLSSLVAVFALRLVVFQTLSLSFSLIFFPLVMLPEPMTSPREFKEQIAFGALAGFGVVFLGFSGLVPADSYLLSLLILNSLLRLDILKRMAAVFQI